MGVCKDGDLRAAHSSRRTDDELPAMLGAMRSRWSSAEASVSDRQISIALRRVIESDA